MIDKFNEQFIEFIKNNTNAKEYLKKRNLNIIILRTNFYV